CPSRALGDVYNSQNLPLPAITEIQVKAEEDISTFNTVCWGLHDAYIESINQVDDDLIVNFDTTWKKHIIITFHKVKEARNLENIECILDSTFKIGNDCIMWEVLDGFDSTWNGLDENDVFVIAQRITWKLLID
ncbi:MAG: hypothetical protein K2K04_02945, partial [Clostridia bacterium]|nr:hypothetical protein [Clostridia bacterium]